MLMTLHIYRWTSFDGILHSSAASERNLTQLVCAHSVVRLIVVCNLGWGPYGLCPVNLNSLKEVMESVYSFIYLEVK